jgi:hypothetical protein
MSGMAEVLAGHSDYLWRSVTGWECHCGHPILTEPVGAGEFFAKHQEEELTAAGFGDVAEAKAKAWDRGMADMVKLTKAGPGYEMGNPYRAAAVRGEG